MDEFILLVGQIPTTTSYNEDLSSSTNFCFVFNITLCLLIFACILIYRKRLGQFKKVNVLNIIYTKSFIIKIICLIDFLFMTGRRC